MVGWFLQGKAVAGVERSDRAASAQFGAGGRGLMGGPPIVGERGWGHHAVRAVGP